VLKSLVSAPGTVGRLCSKICFVENRFPDTDCGFANDLVKYVVIRFQPPEIFERL